MENKYKEIIISNTAEAFRNIIRKIRNEKEFSRRLSIEHSLCQRALFWGGDDKVVVTPHPIKSKFLKVNSGILGYKNVKNISPKKTMMSLCEALMRDGEAFNDLVEIIKSNRNMSITSYAITDEFLLLIDSLRRLKLQFTVPELPKLDSIWTVKYLDSKSGFRETVYRIQAKEKNVKLPFGFICKDINEANQIGQWFLSAKRSCVLKSNFGESGWGLKILKKDQTKSVENESDRDTIWDDALIIVEEYLQSNVNSAGGSPSIEIYVGEDGPKITYICGQIVDNLGSFGGVTIGKDILSKKETGELTRLGKIVGKEYWKMGYRGYFDIDVVVEKDTKHIYLIETNARRTGGTHVYDIAKKLFGKGWEQNNFLVSNDQFCYGKKVMPAQDIFDKCKDLLYPIDIHQSGIIITLIDEQRPIFGFVVAGRNKAECLKMYKELTKLFQQ